MRISYWLKPKEVWIDIRYTVRRFVGFFQRGRRGWAPHDTWSFDKYLSLILADGLEHMAEHAHGWPYFIQEELGYTGDGCGALTPEQDEICLEEWKSWLRQKAWWFRWYYNEEIGLTENQSDETKRRLLDWYNQKEKHFYNVVLPDFTKRFGNLWD